MKYFKTNKICRYALKQYSQFILSTFSSDLGDYISYTDISMLILVHTGSVCIVYHLETGENMLHI